MLVLSTRTARTYQANVLGSKTRRGYLTYPGTGYQGGKVRVFPFPYGTEEAIIRLGPRAAALAASRDPVSGATGSSTGFTRSPPSFMSERQEVIRPVQIKPVYFPAWIVDAEAQFDGSLQYDKNSHERPFLVQFYNTYLPGNNDAFLKGMQFNTRVIENTPGTQNALATQWKASMGVQHGSRIQCLPFTLSPLSLSVPNSIKRTLRMDIPISTYEDSSFKFIVHLQSLHWNYFAVYPVVHPLYVAEYKDIHGANFGLVLNALTGVSHYEKDRMEYYLTDGMPTMSLTLNDNGAKRCVPLRSIWGPNVDSETVDIQGVYDYSCSPSALDALADTITINAAKESPVLLKSREVRSWISLGISSWRHLNWYHYWAQSPIQPIFFSLLRSWKARLGFSASSQRSGGSLWESWSRRRFYRALQRIMELALDAHSYLEFSNLSIVTQNDMIKHIADSRVRPLPTRQEEAGHTLLWFRQRQTVCALRNANGQATATVETGTGRDTLSRVLKGFHPYKGVLEGHDFYVYMRFSIPGSEEPLERWFLFTTLNGAESYAEAFKQKSGDAKDIALAFEEMMDNELPGWWKQWRAEEKEHRRFKEQREKRQQK